MMARVSVSVQPVLLRNLIGNQSEMQICGGRIVRMLLQALLELDRLDKHNRYLQPNTISLSRGFELLTFIDISNMCDSGSEADLNLVGIAPYSASRFREFDTVPKSVYDWDFWSVGVIILEILVGSQLILSCRDYDEIVSLMNGCKEYLDPQLHQLLQILMIEGEPQDLQYFLDEVLNDQSTIVAENVRGLREAFMEDSDLKSKQLLARYYVGKNIGELGEKHNYTRRHINMGNLSDSRFSGDPIMIKKVKEDDPSIFSEYSDHDASTVTEAKCLGSGETDKDFGRKKS